MAIGCLITVERDDAEAPRSYKIIYRKAYRRPAWEIAGRAPREGHTATQGMEIQILDQSGPQYEPMKLRPEQYHGSIYDVLPARTGFLRKPGTWNEQEISANGRRIAVRLNGALILDADLDMVRESEIVKKHPGLARTSGHIALLGHGSRVEFRNLRIKILP